MPTYCKIPWKVRDKIGAVCCGRYAVFAPLLKAGPAFTALDKKHQNKGIPAYGYIAVKGKKYYYCLYGFVGDQSIYTKPKAKKGAKK